MQLAPAIIESLVLKGDLSGLNPSQRVDYYNAYCQRIGLDPATQPFKIITQKGKTVLYADRGCAAQINKKYLVSHQIVSREVVDQIYVVTARAYQPDGRQTESIGAVALNNAKGEELANAMMKAETKAKRRSTLDLIGLGILDESEIEDMRNAVERSASIEVPPPVEKKPIQATEVKVEAPAAGVPAPEPDTTPAQVTPPSSSTPPLNPKIAELRKKIAAAGIPEKFIVDRFTENKMLKNGEKTFEEFNDTLIETLLTEKFFALVLKRWNELQAPVAK